MKTQPSTGSKKAPALTEHRQVTVKPRLLVIFLILCVLPSTGISTTASAAVEHDGIAVVAPAEPGHADSGTAGHYPDSVLPVAPERRNGSLVGALVFPWENDSLVNGPGGGGSQAEGADSGTAMSEATSGAGNSRPSAREVSAMAYDEARHEFVAFGGFNDGGYGRNDTWVLRGNTWIEQQPIVAPPPRFFHNMVYDAARREIVLFGGFSFEAGVLNDTWTWDGITWTEEDPDSVPPPRRGATMVYDSARGETVLFGGQGDKLLKDTWSWDGTTWTQQESGLFPPPARVAAMAAYHGDKNELVLFGGYGSKVPGASPGPLDDTWVWDGASWTEKDPENSPPARSFGAMTYDAGRAESLLFYGLSDTSLAKPLDDTWVWDGSNWSQQPNGARRPPAVLGSTVAYNSDDGYTLLFSGTDYRARSNDSWVWDGKLWSKIQKPHSGAWTRVDPLISPPVRSGATTAFDVARGEVMLFGGRAGAGQRLDDTWTWDDEGWEQHEGLAPPARANAAMAYHEAAGSTVLFGGNSAAEHMWGDTWTWDGTRWSLRTPLESPLPRDGVSMAMDAAGNVVLFGGFNYETGYLGDTWTWDGSEWALQQPTASPPPRGYATMAYDPSRKQTVLLGGFRDGEMLGDTWVWDGSNWAEAQPAGPVRMLGASTYDPAAGKIVLFNGSGWTEASDTDGRSNSSGAFSNWDLNDTWFWSGSGWVRQDPSFPPPRRTVSTIVGDPVRGNVVMFGGYSNDEKRLLNDTWTWQGKVAGADLALSRSGSTGPAATGSSATYTLAVQNLGPDDSTAVVENMLPAHEQLVRADPSRGSCNSSERDVVCDLGSLTAGEGATIEIEVNRGAGGTLTNRAVVRGDTIDFDPTNNSAQARSSSPEASPSPSSSPSQTPTSDPSASPSAGSGCASGPGYPATPNDPHFGPGRTIDPLGATSSATQWGPQKIKANSAWQEDSATGCEIAVAVLDSGVDLQHEDLSCAGKLKVVPGSDVSSSDDDPDDENGHGTHVAGIIGACTNNGKGIAGVAPDATIIPIRVLDENGQGGDSELIAGIDGAVAAGADVINMSLSYKPAVHEIFDFSSIDDAIKRAVDAGVVVVAAAGNDSFPLCNYPAIAADIVCVGATDPRDNKAWYSNSPEKLETGAALVAPGGTSTTFCDVHSEDILSLWPRELDECFEGMKGYSAISGTSMAAPHVAGVAALVYGRLGGVRSPENAQAVIDALTSSAVDLGVPGDDPVYGSGRIDALAAVCSVGPSCDGGVDPTETPTDDPTTDPTTDPSTSPTTDPSTSPTTDPSTSPTTDPSTSPTTDPSQSPTADPSQSPTADPTTDPGPTTPAAPSNATARAASSSRIEIAWADNSSNETGFTIERSLDGSKWTEIATAGRNATMHLDMGLEADTSYFYRVRAMNPSGYSPYSNTASATTMSEAAPGGGAASAPAAPTGLTATSSSPSRIELSWSDASGNEDGFALERSLDGSTWQEIATTARGQTSYLDTELEAGTTYHYRARAYNSAGHSAYSAASSATTKAAPQEAPQKPSPEPSESDAPVTGDETGTGTATTSLATSESLVEHGSGFELSGIVQRDAGCSGPLEIEVSRRVHGTTSYEAAGSTTVSGSGAWGLQVTGERNSAYVAQVKETDSCQGEASTPADVLVRAKLALKAPARCRGALRGTLSPDYPGSKVTLEKKGRKGWKNAGKAELDSDSSFKIKPGKCGLYRVTWSEDGAPNEAARSRLRI